MELKHIAEARIQALAAPGAEPTREEQAHFQACTACREELQAYKVIFSALPEELDVDLGPDFEASVIARIPELQPQAQTERSFKWSWLWIPLGVAVTVLFFVAFFTYFPETASGMENPDWAGSSAEGIGKSMQNIFGGSTLIWFTAGIGLLGFGLLEKLLRRSDNRFSV